MRNFTKVERFLSSDDKQFNLEEISESLEAIAKEILNNENAFIVLNNIIKLDPKNAIAYNLRGQFYYYKKKYDDAISDYSESIAIDPKFRAVFYNRGLSYKKKWAEVKDTATKQEQFHFATSAIKDFKQAIDGIYSNDRSHFNVEEIEETIKTLSEEHRIRTIQVSAEAQRKLQGYSIHDKREEVKEEANNYDPIDSMYAGYPM